MRRTIGGFKISELATGIVLFDIVSWIVAGIEWLIGAAVDVASSIAGALAAMWHVLRPVFAHVWGALRPIWDHVLKPFWIKLSGWFERARAWWDRWARPVTNFLSKVSQFERAIWAASFGPILDTISNLQKLLVVLHLSHTALGRALSDALNHLYQTINNIWQTVTIPINEVIGVIEGILLDVDGLLRVDLLVGSIAKNFSRIWATWWRYSLPRLSRDGRAVLEAARHLRTLAETRQAFHAAVVEHGGPWQDEHAYGRSLFLQVLRKEEITDALDTLPPLE